MRAYKSHFNLQGHHPKVRPWNRHADYGVSIKVARLLSPKVMLLPASDDELLETMVVEMGCPDSGMWYVDTAGCAMLQANDAEPPPQRGWLRKAMQCAAVFLLGLMLLAGPTSCKKDPQPSPTPTPTPTDTITPVNPGDTVIPTPPTPGDTIVPEPPVPMDTVMLPIKLNNVEPYNILYPTPDTIQKLIDSRRVVKLKWYVPPNLTNGWTPGGFSFPRDSLKVRFAMSDKIVGEGKIYVNKNYGGASIPCEDSLNFLILGMTKCDSAIFAGWGFEPYVKYSKSQRDAHVKFLDTIGMQRAILGGKQH